MVVSIERRFMADIPTHKWRIRITLIDVHQLNLEDQS